MISVQQLEIATGCRHDASHMWAQPLSDACKRWEIDTPRKVACFVANVSHDSHKFTQLEEDLFFTTTKACYTAFPAKFDQQEKWRPYLRNPEKLANFVYANQGGNGSAQSGDGWKYRARGPACLRFHDEYFNYGYKSGTPAVSDPDIVSDPVVGADSAGWVWAAKDCNKLAEANRLIPIARAMSKDEDEGRRGARIALMTRALGVFAR